MSAHQIPWGESPLEVAAGFLADDSRPLPIAAIPLRVLADLGFGTNRPLGSDIHPPTLPALNANTIGVEGMAGVSEFLAETENGDR